MQIGAIQPSGPSARLSASGLASGLSGLRVPETLRAELRHAVSGMLGRLARGMVPDLPAGPRLAQSDEFRNPTACPLGGCSATDLRIRFGQIAPWPNWHGTTACKAEGRATPLAHIKRNHFMNPGDSVRKGGSLGKSVFSRETTRGDLEVYGRILHRDGVHVRRPDGSWKVTGSIPGKVVGHTPDGKRTSNLRMILSAEGLVMTMFPVK